MGIMYIEVVLNNSSAEVLKMPLSKTTIWSLLRFSHAVTLQVLKSTLPVLLCIGQRMQRK